LNKNIPESIEAVAETSHLDVLAQLIRYYDEILTQSARNYAFTQDKKWEQRYSSVEPKLDKIIKEAIKKGDERDKEFFLSVDKANLALVKMEYKSIELVYNEQVEEAVKTLESKDYWDQKRIYEQGLRNYVQRRGVKYDEALLNSTKTIELATTGAQNLIETSLKIVLTVTIIALMFAIGIGIYISRSISTPITKLKTATVKIGKGKLDTRVDLKSKDEIGQLAVSFNKMTEDLQKKDISLRESEEKYRRLIENLQDNYFFYVHDTEGIFTYISPSITNVLGYSAEEFLSHYSEYLTDNPINKEVIKHTALSIQSIKQPPYEVEIYHKDGTIRSLQVQEVPISDTNGNVIAVEGIAQDITERKQSEEELSKYHERLEELVKKRTAQLEAAQTELVRKERLAVLGQLTATVNHEIRNPLGTLQNAVYSIGEAIKHNEMERVGHSLKLAERNIKRCNRIINELMDFTRTREIKGELTDIDRWLNSVLDEQEIPEGIECVRGLNTGIVLPIDREYLRRAVNNVVTNAVQAMQDENSSGNQLKVKSAVNGERLELSFIDTGPGISEEIMVKIFEPLFSTKSFGIGLGMPIIKNIMEEHQGEVKLQSEVDKGTVVTLILPIHKLEKKR
jgi:PAS domain S-box-containing protein